MKGPTDESTNHHISWDGENHRNADFWCPETMKPTECFERSAEYWIGWAVAYYQWYSGRKYIEIFDAFSFDDLKKLYPTLHEANISKFTDLADARLKECFPETNLKRIRTIYGCTQAELSECSGVSLRSIQMYEQRNKNINKAAADTVYRLAKALGCVMEEMNDSEKQGA